MEKCVQHLDVYINSNNIKDGALQVIRYIRPKWSQTNIEFQLFTDGITNRLIGCYYDNNFDDMVLIRVYGENTELFIDRKVEVRNMQTMHKSGLIPPLYCTFNNGICYGYSPGLVLDEKMVRDPLISRLISDMMARMHTLRPVMNSSHVANGSYECQENPSEPQPCVFRGLRKFLDLMPQSFNDSQQEMRFKKHVPKRDILIAEVDRLEYCLKKLNSSVVFCHNDLLLKNIIYNCDKKSVNFIDFEYGDYNYQAFDIANHFCEFAGVDTYNPSLYPDREFQIRWLRNYLESWHALKGYNSQNGILNGTKNVLIEKEVEILYKQVSQFALAAHLYWSCWAMVQAHNSSIDFDFLGYAIQRLQEYYSKREQLLHLNISK